MQNNTNRDINRQTAQANQTPARKTSSAKATAGKGKSPLGKTIFNFVIALVLTLVVTGAFLCTALDKTLFNADYAVKVIEKYDIDGATGRNIESELMIQLQNGGVDNEFIKSLIQDNISENFINNVKALYGKSEIDKENADYKAFLNEKFWGVMEEQGGGKVDRSNADAQAVIDELVDIVLTVYNNNMTLPFDADEVVAPYINRFEKVFSVSSVLTIAAAVIIMIIMAVVNKKDGFGIPYMATSFGASAIIFIGLYALLNISGYVKNITMPNEADTLLVKAINDGASNILLVSFIISAVISAIFLAISLVLQKKYTAKAGGVGNTARPSAASQAGRSTSGTTGAERRVPQSGRSQMSGASQAQPNARAARPQSASPSTGTVRPSYRQTTDDDDDEPVFENRPRGRQ